MSILEERLRKAEEINTVFLNRNNESALRNRMRKLRTAPLKYISHLVYKAGIRYPVDRTVETFWGSKYTIPLWDENGVVVYYAGALGFAESRVARFLMKNIRQHSVFYDLGANFGYYSSLGLSCGAEVHAFEPNPSTVAYVRKNAPKALVNEVAVTDKNGSMNFFDTSPSKKSGMSTLYPTSLPEKNFIFSSQYKVQCVTLDTYVQQHHAPTVMKIDVENAEYAVIAGAEQMLQKHSPLIVMELNLKYEGARENTYKVFTMLRNAGYEAYPIELDGSIGEPIQELTIKMGDNFCFRKTII